MAAVVMRSGGGSRSCPGNWHQRKLLALTPLEIERLYLQLAESGGRTGRPVAAKTIRNTHVVLRKALDDAERLGMVQRNAAAGARPPVAHRTEQQTWSGCAHGRG